MSQTGNLIFLPTAQQVHLFPGRSNGYGNILTGTQLSGAIILQYNNVYGDISYILHNDKILPLLKATLRHEIKKLRERVLLELIFLLCENHKTEKQMLVDLMSGLDDKEFDLIARDNPERYLYNHLHGSVD
jgi:hypothetical protein